MSNEMFELGKQFGNLFSITKDVAEVSFVVLAGSDHMDNETIQMFPRLYMEVDMEKIYKPGDIVSKNGGIYRCISSGTFDEETWETIKPQSIYVTSIDVASTFGRV